MTTNEEKILKILKEIEVEKEEKGFKAKTPEQRLQAQLDLLVGFDPNDINKKVTMREVLKNKITIDFSKLSSVQKAEITSDRIRNQRRFELFIGKTYVNKQRALKELKKTHIRDIDLLNNLRRFKKLAKAKKKIRIAESLMDREFNVIRATLIKCRGLMEKGELKID